MELSVDILKDLDHFFEELKEKGLVFEGYKNKRFSSALKEQVLMQGGSAKRYQHHFDALASAVEATLTQGNLFDQWRPALLLRVHLLARYHDDGIVNLINEHMGTTYSRQWLVRQVEAQKIREEYDVMRPFKDSDLLYRLSLISSPLVKKAIFSRGFIKPSDCESGELNHEVSLKSPVRSKILEALKLIRGPEQKQRRTKYDNVKTQVLFDRLAPLLSCLHPRVKRNPTMEYLAEPIDDLWKKILRFTTQGEADWLAYQEALSGPEVDLSGASKGELLH